MRTPKSVLTFVLPATLLTACAGAPRPGPEPVSAAEVVADIRAGAARSFDHCSWLPGSSGFSLAPQGTRRSGQLVVMDDALLWGAFDLARGHFRPQLRIPFTSIRSIALARQGTDRMLSVESEGRVDSFYIEQRPAPAPGRLAIDADATTQAYLFLRKMLGLGL